MGTRLFSSQIMEVNFVTRNLKIGCARWHEHKFTSLTIPKAMLSGEVHSTLQRLILKLSGGDPKKWSAVVPDACMHTG